MLGPGEAFLAARGVRRPARSCEDTRMGFFDDMFDARRHDAGQLEALRQHDASLGSLERDLDELAFPAQDG